MTASRSTHLFTGVVQILAKPFPILVRNLRQSYLIRRDLLSCRLTCSTWQKAVNSFYQGASYGHFDIKNQICSGINDWNGEMLWRKRINEIFVLTRHERNRPVEIFMQNFNETHQFASSPLISRSVSFQRNTLEEFTPEQVEAFEQATDSILTKYGTSIWYLSFFLRGDFDTHVVEYQKLCERLLHTPNLKILQICYRFKHFFDSTEKDKKLLQNEVDKMDVTKFPGLEMLRLINVPTPILRSLLKQNDHVAQMELDLGSCNSWCPIIYETSLTNLKVLSLRIFTRKQFSLLERHETNWPLKKLTIMFDDSLNKYISWSRIIKMISRKWSNTLIELVLHLPKPNTESDKQNVLDFSHSYRLNLSCLQSIKLEACTPFYLDFLLSCKNTLENVQVHIKYDQLTNDFIQRTKLERGDHQIEFFGFEDMMQDSNIWQVLPKVKIVKICAMTNVLRRNNNLVVYTPNKQYRFVYMSWGYYPISMLRMD